MLSEWELWACAQKTIDDAGDDASFVAAQRADDLLDSGNLDGARTWRLIRLKILDLQRGRGNRDLVN